MKIIPITLCFFTLFFTACSDQESSDNGVSDTPLENKELNIGAKNQDVKNENIEVEGSFLFAIGTDGGKKDSFDRDYSDITIQKDQLVIRVKSRDGVVLFIGLSGPEIVHNPVRKYVPMNDPKEHSPYKATVTILGVFEGDNRNPNILKRGELVIENIDYKNGMIKGYYVQLGGRQDDANDENLVEFHGNFEFKGLVVQEKRQ